MDSPELAPCSVFLTARCLSPQVETFGAPVSIPVCDDSAVRVECLDQERLGVNVTWKLQLGDVPPASLPELRDVGTFPFTATLKKPCRRSGSRFPHLLGGASEAITSSRERLGRVVGTWLV